MGTPLSKIHRLFRFRLLTLLIVLTIFAAWIGKLSYEARTQMRVVAELKKLNLHVSYDYNREAIRSAGIRQNLPGPDRLRQLVGDDYFQTVIGVSRGDNVDVTDEDLIYLAALPELESIVLYNNDIGDEGLS